MRKGRFGPYVKHGKTNATLPKDLDMDDVTLEQAVELIAAKVAKGGAKKAKPNAKSKPKKKKATRKSGSKAKTSGTETDSALTEA